MDNLKVSSYQNKIITTETECNLDLEILKTFNCQNVTSITNNPEVICYIYTVFFYGPIKTQI